MKNFTMILGLLCGCMIASNAQITNNGFEDWTTVGAYEDPNGWATMNAYSAGPFYSCTKSTDHFPSSVGNYSIRLENNTSLTQMTGAFGMAITNSFNFPFEPAFPIVGHPTSLNGYFKYSPQNGDSLFIRVILFQGGVAINMMGGLISSDAFISSATTTTWTPFTIPFDTYATADSATIWISAFVPSGPTDAPAGNSVLYVDNLSFDNLIVSVEDEVNTSNFHLFPNPASDFVQVNVDQIQNNMSLNIYNALGEMVRSQQLQANQSFVPVNDLSNGLYIMELKTSLWSKREQLIIQR